MKSLVAIVDNFVENSRHLGEILQDSFDVTTLEDISALKEYIENRNMAVIIMSAVFLVGNKNAVFSALKKSGKAKNVPVIVMGKPDEIETLGYVKGISDYIAVPFADIEVVCRVRNAAELSKYRKKAERLRKRADGAKEARLREVQDGIVALMTGIVETRNPKCGAHTRFVRLFAEVIATDIMNNCPQYGLTKDRVHKIAAASLIHDIGKVAVPDSILFKPDKLSDEEYECMKKHTSIGRDLFENTRKIWSKEYAELCRDVILYHHERYDGKGYPCGLVGEQIPIEAQIVSLADVYDALVARRIYKRNILPEKAFDMIINGECGAFSDTMLESLKRVKGKLENLIK